MRGTVWFILFYSVVCRLETAGVTWTPALGTNTTTVVVYSGKRTPYALGNHLEFLLAHLRQFQTQVKAVPLAHASVEVTADYVIVFCPQPVGVTPGWITNRLQQTLWLGPGGDDLPRRILWRDGFTDVKSLNPLLFQFYGIPPPEKGQLLLRISDYGCQSDHRKFRRVADLLFARRIPFAVGVQDCDLSAKEEFVRNLRYAEERGGRLILQTQFRFWDPTMDRPLTADVSETLRVIAAAFRQHGLTLRGWENTGPSPPRRLEQGFGEIFPLRIGAARFSDATSKDEVVARNLIRDAHGTVIVPGAFGYVSSTATNSFEDLRALGQEILASGGAAGSLVFHAYLPFSTFVTSMDEIESWHVAFMDLAELR